MPLSEAGSGKSPPSRNAERVLSDSSRDLPWWWTLTSKNRLSGSANIVRPFLNSCGSARMKRQYELYEEVSTYK